MALSVSTQQMSGAKRVSVPRWRILERNGPAIPGRCHRGRRTQVVRFAVGFCRPLCRPAWQVGDTLRGQTRHFPALLNSPAETELYELARHSWLYTEIDGVRPAKNGQDVMDLCR